jgi:hypothetical protein
MKKVTWASLVSSSEAPQSEPQPKPKQPKQGGNKMLHCQAAGCKFKTGGPSGMGRHYKDNPTHRPLYKQRELAKKAGLPAPGVALGAGRIKCKGTLATGQKCTFSTDNNQEMGLHYTAFPNHRKKTRLKTKTKEVTKTMAKEGALRRSSLADLSGGPSVFEKLSYFRSDFVLEIKAKEKIIVQLRDQLEKAEYEMKTLMAGLEVLNATISAKNPQHPQEEPEQQPQQSQQPQPFDRTHEVRDRQDYTEV